jgi:two-component system, OmpR family, phosphate regulon sensor histidine kinase PhoR
MTAPHFVTRTLVILAALAVGGLLLGALFGHAGFGMAGGLLAWAALHLRQLIRLQLWLSSRRLPVPETGGTWQVVFDSLDQRRRNNRRTRRRLLAALAAFRDAARALPDGIIAIDDTDTIHWFNKAAKRLLGLRYPADIGNHLTHLVRTPRFLDWFAAGRLDVPLIDLPSPEDESVRLLCRLIAYRPGFRLLIVRDVSNLMRLEQVRRDFVANVSHELRTPLTVINGYMEALDPEELGEFGELFVSMRQQSRRMASIVDDLLMLSRLEAQQKVNDEPVDVGALLTAIRRDTEALSAGRHRIEIDAGSALGLRGSPRDLQSAFSNLAFNAVRYTPEGGRIHLQWQCSPEGGVFAVSDTGQGIPAQHLPRLTERFYRVSNSRSRESGGTGLGLAIVKHVLSLHGAHLDIRSEVGKGSTFRCIFPLTRLLDLRDALEQGDRPRATAETTGPV